MSNEVSGSHWFDPKAYKKPRISATCEAITSQHADVISRCGAESTHWLLDPDGETTTAFCIDHALALGRVAMAIGNL